MKTQVPVVLRTAVWILVSGWAGIAAGQSLMQLGGVPKVAPGPPRTFGTTQESFFTVGEWEFDPVVSTQTYSDTATASLNTLRYSTGGGGNVGFFAAAHLPDGAVLTSLTFDLCDSNTSNSHWLGGLMSCGSVDGLCAGVGDSVQSVSNVTTPCAAYTQDISGLNYTVNNQTQRLVFLVNPGTTDNTNAIAGAVLGYKLQVSPAPGTATFGDVPTDHPFFQFIEALAKSGITGGCGAGNYCPDNPVTRGQMAVFLAKGLGLQFP